MRIALVHYTAAPVIGGVEQVLAAHARLFREAGHEVTLLAEWSQLPPAYSPRVAALRAWLKPKLAEQAVVFLHNVATMHFDLALTAVLWEIAAELPAVRFIAWVHDLAACNPDYVLPSPENSPASLLRRANPRFAYVAVSEWRKQQLIALTGLPESDCLVIPNGVDPAEVLDLAPRIRLLEAECRLLDRDILLLQPARLLRRKNVELTLEMTACLKAQQRSCACLITAPPDVHHAASREYAEELKLLVRQLGLEDDAFFLDELPPLDAAEMRSLFQLADALFFPSRQEGFGIPLLEAGLHRLPIFCAEIDPLMSLLPEATFPFSLSKPPAELASELIARLEADVRHQARKQTLRDFSWRAIYRNFLARLLG
jgi:glycosyltransferase involved in cell wall biosynthesis